MRKNVKIDKIHIVKDDKKNTVEFIYSDSSDYSVDLEKLRLEIIEYYKADKVLFTFTEIE